MAFARGVLKQVMSAAATQPQPVKRDVVTRRSALGAGAMLSSMGDDDQPLGRAGTRRRGVARELLG